MKNYFISVLAVSVLLFCTSCTGNQNSNNNNNQSETMELSKEWDKIFSLSDSVNHRKVTFINNYGITLAADLYTPKQTTGKLSAIAVSGPFGSSKEQASGLYAHEMAKRGFLTLAFDPSFTGESGGEPRRTASPDINTEDYMAAVDYLSTLDNVDVQRIGIIGICGWGGIALNAAAADTRIKATVAATMYDMTRVFGNSYFDANDNEEARFETRKAMAIQRTKDAQTHTHTQAGGVVDPLPSDAPQFVKDYYDFYKTPRGYHARSGNSNDGWHATGCQAYQNARFLYYINEIRSAILVMHGEKAHSRYFGESAYNYMLNGKAEGYHFVGNPNPVPDNKELLIVPGASHCDLYDGGFTELEGKGESRKMIPWQKIVDFFRTNLK